MKEPSIYIAGPFFNSYEVAVIERIKIIIADFKFEYFSPKDELMYKPGVTTPEDILRANINGLDTSNMMIVVTDGKDPGTMFEAGWAYSKGMPIIYMWLTGTKEQKFNIMLAATGSVVRSFDQLFQALEHLKATSMFHQRNWGEDMNYE
jgi:nucleoside 2-deoxyribosyltransferase